jgi:hypothetical protein
MGDFIYYGTSHSIARIDHIFVHELLRKRRIFLKIRDVQSVQDRDEVLDVPSLFVPGLDEVALRFVGLPAIDAKKLYILPVTRSAQGLRLRRIVEADRT